MKDLMGKNLKVGDKVILIDENPSHNYSTPYDFYENLGIVVGERQVVVSKYPKKEHIGLCDFKAVVVETAYVVYLSEIVSEDKVLYFNTLQSYYSHKIMNQTVNSYKLVPGTLFRDNALNKSFIYLGNISIKLVSNNDRVYDNISGNMCMPSNLLLSEYNKTVKSKDLYESSYDIARSYVSFFPSKLYTNPLKTKFKEMNKEMISADEILGLLNINNILGTFILNNRYEKGAYLQISSLD